MKSSDKELYFLELKIVNSCRDQIATLATEYLNAIKKRRTLLAWIIRQRINFWDRRANKHQQTALLIALAMQKDAKPETATP